LGKWAGTRGLRTNVSQLKGAITTLREVTATQGGSLTVEAVTLENVRECTRRWRDHDRLAAETINARVRVLSSIGVDCTGCWQSPKRLLKWWLSPEKMALLLQHLRSRNPPFLRAQLMADYVEWTSYVGLRVEESLRLTWDDVRLDVRVTGDCLTNLSEITVPGTKTGSAQASLALSLIPALLLQRRKEAAVSSHVFPISYRRLKRDWQHCRAFLGATDNKMATLKALRRTAARSLTVNGMPTAVLMSYLRHSNIKTTMGYLRLTGGYSTAEQRRWL
jgi:integrase